MIAVLALLVAQEVVVPSDVDAVTVYASGAYVRRVATAPGDGVAVVAGLPGSIDRESLRVRCDGAEVLGVETRERLEPGAPEARAQELAARIEAIEGALADLEDQDLVLAALERHVSGLFRAEERAYAAGELAGREQRLDWLAARLRELSGERRDLAAGKRGTEIALADAHAQLGEVARAGERRVVDVLVELAGAAADARLAVEYLVADAGWTPVYDLRAPKSLEKVELVHRARVRQASGEDWTDVELALSTAEPRRGVVAPEPPSVWLDLASDVALRERADARKAALQDEDLAGDAAGAAVEDSGLSVRYVLPRRETVESRAEPTTVLVGSADLAVAPEHVVVPALDTTVWLRALATNTSPWVLLPGRAAVFFGADFVGYADLDGVQRGEPLVLDLGADPGFEVERVVLSEETDEAGLFSSRDVWRRKLRFRVTNRGAFSARGGPATVWVQESVPRSNDERVVVELADARPAPASGLRFDELRAERGVESWLVTVPRGEERTVEVTIEISYPESLELVRW